MSPDISETSVLRRDAQTATEVLDGEAVVLDERTRTLHVLSPTASVIWENLDGELSVEELSAALSDAFGAPLDVVRADTLAAIRSFAEQGLLEGSATAGTTGAGSADVSSGSDAGTAPRFLRQPPHG